MDKQVQFFVPVLFGNVEYWHTGLDSICRANSFLDRRLLEVCTYQKMPGLSNGAAGYTLQCL